MEDATHEGPGFYPCPDCSNPVEFGLPCGGCACEHYSEDVELAHDAADAEFRAMFPHLSEDEIADIEKVAAEVCPESTDAMDRGWM